MDDEAKLKLMKKRIIGSFKWREDIIIPLSKEFGVSIEEVEDLFMDLLDMSSLEALHSTFESANELCLFKKLYADLRFCWFVDTLELITKDQSDNLIKGLIEEIVKGKSYEDALDEGKKEIFQLLKENKI